MKKALLGLTVAVLTFAIGVLADGPSIEGIGPPPVVESDIYICPMLDETYECSPFDCFQVRIKGSFDPMDDVYLGTMGGHGWIRVSCIADAASCKKLFVEPPPGFENGLEDDLNVDVVGRYTDRAIDPHPGQRGDKVRLLQVTQVIRVESSRYECPYGSGCGRGNGSH